MSYFTAFAIRVGIVLFAEFLADKVIALVNSLL